MNLYVISYWMFQEERTKVDELRGSPMSVGTLEEIIDDNHAIVSTSVGSEHYVSILSFVDKDQLEPGCSVLLNHKVRLDLELLHHKERLDHEFLDHKVHVRLNCELPSRKIRLDCVFFYHKVRLDSKFLTFNDLTEISKHLYLS